MTTIPKSPIVTDDALLKWRAEFPILHETTYLVSNSLGAMPRRVYDSLRDYADTWASRGVRAWGEGWWDMNVETGNKIAPIIGAAPYTVSMHQNVSIAIGILLSCFDLAGPRRKVVITDMIFPSVYYTLHGMVSESMQIVSIPSEDGIGVDLQPILDAIDEQTQFVCIDHVFFRTAFILDIEKIIQKAHQVGAFVILDAYHSGGIVPLNVTALNVDFAIGGVLKWMCGGPGGVFMYARPDYLKTLKPKLTGWMAHRHPFAFDLEMDFREDAFRLLNGTPAVPSLFAIQPGIDIIAQVGVENIRRKSMHQTALLIERAEAAGYKINAARDPAQRGGTVTLNPKHAYEVSRELLARQIIIDYRAKAGIRISPHFYNSDAEMLSALDTIGEILADGSWRNHLDSRAFVT